MAAKACTVENAPCMGALKELDASAGADQSSLSYTQLPVPAQLTVKPSCIPGAGLGVFANRSIPRGVRLGQYEGKRVNKGDIVNTAYAWEVKDRPYYIDGHDPAHSNWMRFVNCARNDEEQNTAAFQFEGQIFYRTIKNIYPGAEVLVWYGDHYARELGISVDTSGLGANHECLGCGDTFVDKRPFYLHIKWSRQCSEANQRNYECGRCKLSFSKSLDLQEHATKKHGKENSPVTGNYSEEERAKRGEFICPSDILQRSRGTGDIIKPYKCGDCGKCFRWPSLLRVHARTHTGEKPYTCEQCGKCFGRRAHLRGHLVTHSGDQPYKCEHQSGSLPKNLQSHAKPYKCEQCGKCFRWSNILWSHGRTHSGVKPYTCEQCGKCFNQRSNLQQHLRTHTGAKPYKCDDCGKCFGQSTSLQYHLRRQHTGDKPYKCEHCGKCFYHSGHLGEHLRSHTGDKPFKCAHCGKCFSQSSSLRTHLRIHTREKPCK